MKVIRDANIFGEVYTSPQEYLDVVKNRPLLYDRYTDRLNDNGFSNSWNGYRSGDKLCKDFLTARVDSDIISDIKSSLTAGKIQSQKRMERYIGVQGYAPVIPLMLKNVPTTMCASRRTPIKNKQIEIAVICSATAGYSADEMRNAGLAICKEVVGLELSGYTVGITAVSAFGNSDSGQTAFVAVRTKSVGHSSDIARVVWAMVNPAFHRGIGFGWYQRTAEVKHQSGYGCSWHADTVAIGRNLGKDVIVLRLNTLLRSSESDIRDTIKNAVEMFAPARA